LHLELERIRRIQRRQSLIAQRSQPYRARRRPNGPFSVNAPPIPEGVPASVSRQPRRNRSDPAGRRRSGSARFASGTETEPSAGEVGQFAFVLFLLERWISVVLEVGGLAEYMFAAPSVARVTRKCR
jgi:hypothetical protein